MQASEGNADFVASFAMHRQRLVHHAAAVIPIDGAAAPDAASVSKLSQTLVASLELLKVAEEELADERRRNAVTSAATGKRIAHLQMMFDLAPGALLLTTMDTSIREMNRAAGTLLNQEAYRLEGKQLLSLVPAARVQAFRKELAQVIEMSRVAAWTFSLERRGNTPISVTATVEIIDDAAVGARALYWNIRASEA
jgi:PAS domain-containing protein